MFMKINIFKKRKFLWLFGLLFCSFNPIIGCKWLKDIFSCCFKGKGNKKNTKYHYYPLENDDDYRHFMESEYTRKPTGKSMKKPSIKNLQPPSNEQSCAQILLSQNEDEPILISFNPNELHTDESDNNSKERPLENNITFNKAEVLKNQEILERNEEDSIDHSLKSFYPSSISSEEHEEKPQDQ